MYNFKPILENRSRIRRNKTDLDTVEKMMGLEKPEGELKRKGDLPEELSSPFAEVEYQMDGDIAKLKVEEPAAEKKAEG